jgi:hypothetical protein
VMPATNPPKQVSSSSSSICLTMTSSPREGPGDSNNDEGELWVPRAGSHQKRNPPEAVEVTSPVPWRRQQRLLQCVGTERSRTRGVGRAAPAAIASLLVMPGLVPGIHVFLI